MSLQQFVQFSMALEKQQQLVIKQFRTVRKHLKYASFLIFVAKQCFVLHIYLLRQISLADCRQNCTNIVEVSGVPRHDQIRADRHDNLVWLQQHTDQQSGCRLWIQSFQQLFQKCILCGWFCEQQLEQLDHRHKALQSLLLGCFIQIVLGRYDVGFVGDIAQQIEK